MWPARSSARRPLRSTDAILAARWRTPAELGSWISCEIKARKRSPSWLGLFRNAEIVPSLPHQEARAWRQRGFSNGLLGQLIGFGAVAVIARMSTGSRWGGRRSVLKNLTDGELDPLRRRGLPF